MPPIVGFDPKIIEFLRALGVSDPENTGHVIIDIPVDDAVRIYVTRPADAEGFDFRFSEGAFHIVTVPKTKDEPVRRDGLRKFPEGSGVT